MVESSSRPTKPDYPLGSHCYIIFSVMQNIGAKQIPFPQKGQYFTLSSPH